MTTASFVSLAQEVRPRKYSLTLSPDLEEYTFLGEEQVDIEVSAPTSRITMNALGIEVQSASVRHDGNSPVAAQSIDYDKSAETVTFSFASSLAVGQATLSIQFTGALNDQLLGFYHATYRGADGEPRTMATTQFEATDARRAFPCWDEPAVKAIFECTLVVPSHLTTISNTPIASETPAGDGLKRVQFQETPPMSTYLLAFIVAELDSIEARSDGTLIRVLTTPGKVEQGRFALDTAVRLLSYYNEYFGIPYPLEKLDHLAVPDFAAGAMENWGAITYRETALLYDPENSSPATRQRIAEVVAHEMAHMWFGDLVTMAWWNDLWLNESFASWMGTKAVDHLFPDWSMWTQFIVDDLNSGLSLDGLENTHPIEQEVTDPAQINQLFDAISYSKGASVLRMLEQFIGPDKFRAGLYKYLSDHRYDNARGADLWQAMEEESGQPVIQMMNSWIQQPGYPVLRAEVSRQAAQPQVRLSQQRFLYTGLKDDPTLWQVPVALARQGTSAASPVVMGGRQSTLPLGTPSLTDGETWIKVNPGHTGFYRVQYDDEEWQRFIPAIESGELPATDRLGLQGDAYALARSGLISATQFLRLAQAYRNEESYSVWADLAGNLRQVEFLITQEPFLPQFQAMSRELMQPIAQKVGWEPRSGEGHLQVLLRATVLGQLGAFGDAETVRAASQRFARYLQEPSSLAPELKGPVYGLAAQTGDEDTYQAMHRLSQETPLQEEKVRLLQALTRFSDPNLLQRTMQLALSPDVRAQETVAMVLGVAGNRHNGAQMAWDYLKENWAEFDKRYGSGGFAIMRLVGITSNFATAEARQDVEEFFEQNPTPAASRTIQQCLERIDLNTRWLERNRDDLAQWLGQ